MVVGQWENSEAFLWTETERSKGLDYFSTLWLPVPCYYFSVVSLGFVFFFFFQTTFYFSCQKKSSCLLLVLPDRFLCFILLASVADEFFWCFLEFSAWSLFRLFFFFFLHLEDLNLSFIVIKSPVIQAMSCNQFSLSMIQKRRGRLAKVLDCH